MAGIPDEVGDQPLSGDHGDQVIISGAPPQLAHHQQHNTLVHRGGEALQHEAPVPAIRGNIAKSAKKNKRYEMIIMGKRVIR